MTMPENCVGIVRGRMMDVVKMDGMYLKTYLS